MSTTLDSKPLSCIEINPKQTPCYLVIWLHGLGADSSDFVPIIDYLKLSPGHAIRFVFPSAPYRNITINQGMRMRGWYDIAKLDLNFSEDEAGFIESDNLLKNLIDAEIAAGIKSENIMLIGFSQGGALALFTGLRYHKPLGGIVGLSTYLPLQKK